MDTCLSAHKCCFCGAGNAEAAMLHMQLPPGMNDSEAEMVLLGEGSVDAKPPLPGAFLTASPDEAIHLMGKAVVCFAFAFT